MASSDPTYSFDKNHQSQSTPETENEPNLNQLLQNSVEPNLNWATSVRSSL